MSRSSFLILRSRNARLLTAVSITLLAAMTGTAMILAKGAVNSSAARYRRTPAGAFAVLSQKARRAHRASINGPRGAVLATSLGSHQVYAWTGSSAEALASLHVNMPSAVSDICLIEQEPGIGGGGTCGSAKAVAQHGIVGVSEVGDSLHRIVSVLVPNGVEYVTFTDRDGSSYNVKVTHNAVIVDDQDLAAPPTTAVSYKLPGGTTEAMPMPGAPSGL